MHIAIDIDGTITEAPFFLSKLMLSLMDSGNRVTILSADFNGIPTREEKLKQLEGYEITKQYYTELIIVSGNDLPERGYGKACFCRDNAVDAIFEDCLVYIDLIKKISPKTVCWLITK